MTGNPTGPRFNPGDIVTVSARFPTGRRHIRTPFYIRGKTGGGRAGLRRLQEPGATGVRQV